jgi:hypothetical protein
MDETIDGTFATIAGAIVWKFLWMWQTIGTNTNGNAKTKKFASGGIQGNTQKQKYLFQKGKPLQRGFLF